MVREPVVNRRSNGKPIVNHRLTPHGVLASSKEEQMTSTKSAVVTGATSGLGAAAAAALAGEGYYVYIVGRDAERGHEVVAKIQQAGGRAQFVSADLFTVKGVRQLAGEIRSLAPTVDLLVNNAGGVFGERVLTADGLERTFALNVLAPFVLTEELLEPLSRAQGRVVNVVTGVPNGAKATLDELALLTLTKEQQNRFRARGVSVVSLHPGIIPNTRFGSHTPRPVRAVMGFVARVFGMASSIDDAAARFVRIGTGDVEPGGFYREGKLSPAPRLAADPTFARDLWTRLDQVAAPAA
jgi:NAD(P)-dependent dehydrogenase (short-subunit alcohol dehydrogenase family)